MKTHSISKLYSSSLASMNTISATVLQFAASIALSALVTVVLAAIWWLTFLLGWASPPSIAGLVDPFMPVMNDVARFVQFNLTHNLPFVLLAAGVFAAYEVSFRRQVAAGNSPAATLSLFKALSMLLGLLTMAISLYGVLAASAEVGQDPRTLIGSLYFKFGLWALNAILMVARYVWYENTQENVSHA